MSNAALHWARRVRGIKGTQKAVLLLLSDTANDHMEAWPSATTLAADGCLSERAVREALAGLEDAMLIRGERAEGRPTVWKLLIPAEPLAWTPAPAPRKRESASNSGTPERGAPLAALSASLPADGASQGAPALGASPPANGASPPRNVAHPTPERGAPITLSNPHITPIEPSLGDKPRKRGSRIDPDWQPDEAGVAFAGKYGVEDLASTIQHFRDHHAQKATISHDWRASWRTWCQNDKKFRRTYSPGRPQRKTADQMIADYAAAHRDEFGDLLEPTFVPSERIFP